jgi:hypothetical protein
MKVEIATEIVFFKLSRLEEQLYRTNDLCKYALSYLSDKHRQ